MLSHSDSQWILLLKLRNSQWRQSTSHCLHSSSLLFALSYLLSLISSPLSLQVNSNKDAHIFTTDRYGWACQLVDLGRSHICCQNVKPNNFTRLDLNNKVLNHNASVQLSQPLTALVKRRTFVWVQSKVSEQIKHVYLRKLEKAVTIRKLIRTGQTQITSGFEFMHSTLSNYKR